MISLKGLSAFPITPSNRDGQVDVGALRALLDPLIAAKVDSVGLLGSTGSYPYFSRDERRRAVQAATALADGNTPILVGIGALRTDDAVRLAQDARDAGATAGLLAAVSYTPLTDDEVFEHFQTVARESGLPICIYDNPGTTHFQFTPALIGRLSRVEGIVAVKSPALDASTVAGHLRELRAVVPDGVALGYSADWNCTEALLAGGDTWYSVVAGIFPKVCVDIVRAATSGDAARARELNARLQPIWDLFRTYSSLRVVYALANLRGVCTAEPPRPILPLPADAQRRVRETLAAMEID
ncbi:dihydrodipicolinate synthase family protein [Bradyrhizobium brasilense]|uniref:dihydrodipicolinate synthase family protein n=1 Tax=Bradyrhizobium brasilense TaxID=1419277 RepID=UPI0024B23D36|nr:dihydrodipicolinate synthase family protein [Bradyrhizobium australafricanum]WFU29523.1 dihydrodipicolinate synthase family protein [Bradyrhizobium australafricanum]